MRLCRIRPVYYIILPLWIINKYHNHPDIFNTFIWDESSVHQGVNYTFEGTFEGTKVSFWVAASVYQILLLTNNGVRRLSVLWKTTVQRDVLIVALGVHVVAVLTRTPLVNEETTPRRFWRRGSGRRSWPMLRWKFGFKPWLSSPPFTEAPSIKNRPKLKPANRETQ
jgi:hypothetical protein